MIRGLPIGVLIYDSLIEPAKWCAKLRSLLPDSSNIVLDCKMGSGHFGASGRYSYYKEVAADYAFVIDRIINHK
jgi:oligopeptidase B